MNYNYLAPDSVSEILEGIRFIEYWTGKKISSGLASEPEMIRIGNEYLTNNIFDELIVKDSGIEDSTRDVVIRKPQLAWNAYKEMIIYYAFQSFIALKESNGNNTSLFETLNTDCTNDQWINMGWSTYF